MRRLQCELKKQNWHRKSLFLFFQCCNWREVEIKECSFSFTCLMGTFFKKTGYNPICKVFTVFFNRQSSKFHSSRNSFSSKGKGNLVTIVIGSLTAWISVATINWPAQANFYFKRCLLEVCGKIYCSMLAYAL